MYHLFNLLFDATDAEMQTGSVILAKSVSPGQTRASWKNKAKKLWLFFYDAMMGHSCRLLK